MRANEKNSPTDAKPGPAISCWGWLAYLLMVMAVAFLALTGIGTFASGNAPMTHWVLMAHVAVAPAFAIGLAFVALTWSDRCRLGDTPSREKPLARLLFWLMLLCGLVVILSGIVPMLPIFGTHGQHLLYLTHRYGGIVITITVLLHFFVSRSRK